MKKTFPYWKDPYQLKPQRKADYFKNCHNCHYESVAKVDELQLTKCMMCLGDPSRPGWVDKLQMIKVESARAKDKKILGLPKEA